MEVSSRIQTAVINDNCKTCLTPEAQETNRGWPGVPYDLWNPTHAISQPNDYTGLRGWCYVKNDSGIPLKMRTVTEGYEDILLVIDGIAPDGTELHVEMFYELRRGGTDFKVELGRDFFEPGQKAFYYLNVQRCEWHGGKTLSPSPEKGTKRLSQLSNRA